MLLISAKFRFLLFAFHHQATEELHVEGIAASVHLWLFIALSVPQVCARLVDMGRKQGLLPPALNPVHISDVLGMR